MSNARINSILSTLVDSYITNMIEPTGYSTHVTMYIDNEDEESKLLLIDQNQTQVHIGSIRKMVH